MMPHLELRGVFTLIGCRLCNFLVLSLSLDSASDRLLLIVDALLKFNDSVLSVTLLFFNILHKVVEDALRLEAIFFRVTLLRFFHGKDFTLGFQTCIQFRALDFSRDVVLLHSM